jgi:hypothetical protein
MPDGTTLDMWARGMREVRSERGRHAAKRAIQDEKTEPQEILTDTAHGQAYDACNLSERERLPITGRCCIDTSVAKLASSHLGDD